MIIEDEVPNLLDKYRHDSEWTYYFLGDLKLAWRVNNKTGEKEELVYDEVKHELFCAGEWK